MKIDIHHGEFPPGLEYMRMSTGAEQALAYFPGLTDAVFAPRELIRRRERLFGPWLEARTVYIISRRRPLPPGWSLGAMATDYAQAVAAMCAVSPHADQQVDIAGASFGGCVAMRFALDHPRLVRRLVVQQATAQGDDKARDTMAQWIAYLEAGRYLRFATSVVNHSFRGRRRIWNDSVAISTYPLVRRDFRRRQSDLLTSLRAIEHFDVTREVHRITSPTLIVGAGRDLLVPPALLRATARAIPGAELLLFEDASHSVQMEQAQRYGRAVIEFLEGGGGLRPGSAGAAESVQTVPTPCGGD